MDCALGILQPEIGILQPDRYSSYSRRIDFPEGYLSAETFHNGISFTRKADGHGASEMGEIS